MDDYLCGMKGFEGYVGIHLWDGQMVNDLIFALLLLLFMFFAIVFRTNHRLFLKTLRDVFFLRERNSLFEKPVGDERLFRSFMHFQALFLCSVGLFAIARRLGYLMSLDEFPILCYIGALFGILWLFYEVKQFFYAVFGWVFTDREKYRFWKTNYNAMISLWGVTLYLPVLWLLFVNTHATLAVVLFTALYVTCRFVIIYKTIRIFYKKNASLLYISLYLCGQEFLPLILLYKGMDYLYNFIETSALWH